MARCWSQRVPWLSSGEHNEDCEEPVVAVVLVPTDMDGNPDEPWPSHWPTFTCAGHAPELMHELLCTGHEREDLITATLDTKEK